MVATEVTLIDSLETLSSILSWNRLQRLFPIMSFILDPSNAYL